MAVVDLAVIGGGASGLTAALTARRRGASVLLLEAQERLGRKLLATGNGRCNLSHLGATAAAYEGRDPAFAATALARVDDEAIDEFFGGLGLLLTHDAEGRVYPHSMRAQSVVRALTAAVRDAGVTVRLNARVTSLLSPKGADDVFTLGLEGGETLLARGVILAAGGCAAPDLGSGEDGLSLVRALGLPICPQAPALSPLVGRNPRRWRRASGTRFRGEAFYRPLDGSPSHLSKGEFLVTDYGLSGIAAMELALAVELDPSPKKGELVIDFVPSLDEDRLAALLLTWRALRPAATAEDLLGGLLAPKLARVLAMGTDDDAESLAGVLKRCALPIAGTRGYAYAQVMYGGVATAALDPQTMRAKAVPGLWVTGELTDITGRTGGYNLRWAFTTGLLAGDHAGCVIAS